MSTVQIGCHLSASGGYLEMAHKAAALKATTLQFFARNPRGGRARALDPEDARLFRDFTAKNGFGPMLAHAPYTVNPCSAREDVRTFALEAIRGDLERLEQLGVHLYNLHPGSHTGQGVETGISLTAGVLNEVLGSGGPVRILLETMTGKGTEVGSTFEQLAAIIDRIKDPSRIGVCLDTCHVHDAGYDIVHDLDGVLQEFDRIIGLEKLSAVHLNDSQHARGARKDRHEKLGAGQIGIEALKATVLHPGLSHLPFILETPNDDEGYAKEIASIKKAAASQIDAADASFAGKSK